MNPMQLIATVVAFVKNNDEQYQRVFTFFTSYDLWRNHKKKLK